MSSPDYKAFRRLALGANLVPLWDCFTADLLTPVGAYLRLAQEAKYAFLLESVEGGEHVARYTFLGADPLEVIRIHGPRGAKHGSSRSGQRASSAVPLRDITVAESNGSTLHWHDANPAEFLRHRMARYRPARVPGLPPFIGGAIGYMAYDAVRWLERIPAAARDDLHLDDAVLMLFHRVIAFDRVQHKVWILRNVFTEGRTNLRGEYAAAVREIVATRRLLESPLRKETTPARRSRSTAFRPQVRSSMSRPQFLAAVRKCKSRIRAGDAFQIVLSQRFSARLPRGADAFDIYRALRVVNPSPYLFFLKLDGLSVAGSSPEMLIRVQGRDAQYRPIAGTRSRGADAAADARLEAELRADPKERAEHVMLVDLGRNDLGRVSEPGSVRVDQMMTVERYSHVMHLVSALRGRLRADADCFDALLACFPAGTVSGAPKVRAMEIIDALEPTRRGLYAGAVMYLDFSGNLDSCIAIRTLLAKGGRAYVQAGAGIVSDSVPAREFEETVNKAQALLRALDVAEIEEVRESED